MTQRRIEYVSIDDVKPADTNPKNHADDVIRQSFSRFGYTEPVLLDERTGKLVAGHGRIDSLKELRANGKTPPEGVTDDWQIPVVRGWESANDGEARAYLIASNRLVELGGWDNKQLLEVLDSLDDLEGVGYTLEQLQELSNSITELPPTPMTDPDHVPAPPKDPVTKLGDVWELGTHRVVCGDSNVPSVLDSLMGADTATAVVTDPPYGIDLDTDYAVTKQVKGKTYAKVIGDAGPFDAHFLAGYFHETEEQFWFGANYYRRSLSPSDLDGSWLVWDKRSPDSDGGMGSGFELCWSKQRHKQDLLRYLWMGFTAKETNEARVHPTQKPVALISELLERWVPQFSVVVDPFGGSGSTLIACEKTNRNARLVELDPQYVDVICRRFQEHTGIMPILQSTGEAYDFTKDKAA